MVRAYKYQYLCIRKVSRVLYWWVGWEKQSVLHRGDPVAIIGILLVIVLVSFVT